jgi:hypothetical protein
MKNRTLFGLVLGLLLVGLGWMGGCSETSERGNAPPQGHSNKQSSAQENYIPMSDNALLADMCMSPAHFVPHQSELNSTGVRRLRRYVEIMKIYGGTLHYDGVGEEDVLVKDRLNRIETYLVSCGLERKNFSVEPGLAGGAGMRADEDIQAHSALELGSEVASTTNSKEGKSKSSITSFLTKPKPSRMPGRSQPRLLAFSEAETPYQAKYSMPYCIAAAVVDHQVTLATFTSDKMKDRDIVEARKKVHLSFPDVPIWPGLADVGPDTDFVGNPVTIRTTDGRSYNARVDIPRGDPALPLTDDELLAKYRDCGRSQLRRDEIERSVDLVLGLEKVADIGTLIAALSSPSRKS